MSSTTSRADKRKEQREKDALPTIAAGDPQASYVSSPLDFEDHVGGMSEPEEKWYAEFDKAKEEEEKAAEESDQQVAEERQKKAEEEEKEREKEAKKADDNTPKGVSKAGSGR